MSLIKLKIDSKYYDINKVNKIPTFIVKDGKFEKSDNKFSFILDDLIDIKDFNAKEISFLQFDRKGDLVRQIAMKDAVVESHEKKLEIDCESWIDEYLG
jgi:hypothetical protein